MLVTMSDKGLSRYKVINDVCEHRLRRSDAAQILNLSERQVQRLMNRLRESGAASLVHSARGKPSNNRISILGATRPTSQRDVLPISINALLTRQCMRKTCFGLY
ncbi:helix-turn-helix domain-containing protein [Vibrio vulnificus]|uniref:helix-turn-helix domain-containing protein n=2 Tax=Vibrio vulnificus TaxID=672 RepID=UPI00092C1816|nr:hypothetical protein VFL11327_01931 [Vibrio fluvialis]OJI58964.1 hypothetical protein VV1062A_00383 [Vibrio vulnificus]